MRILWITNIPLPPICNEMNIPVPVVGGWMYSSAKRLLQHHEIELAISTIYDGNEFIDKTIDGIRFFLLPLKGKSRYRYQNHLERYWKNINEILVPEITHIHGTEFPHGLSFLYACPNNKAVVSIQGLVSACSRNYFSDIKKSDIIKNITFRDIIRMDTIFNGKRCFEKRGIIEKKIISKCRNVIGRTSWDHSHTLAINPQIQYHFCNETLREPFYSKRWSHQSCIPHSIFISQANYPIKGLHKLMMALPIIHRHYPDAHVFIGGENITDTSSLLKKVKISGYGRYLKRLVKKLSIEKSITFLGSLDEQRMCERFLSSNVFVCCSSIENSPNSLGEAQLLGVPTVASYVGGIPDMVKNRESGLLYPFNEIEMLAHNVCDIFANQELAVNLSKGEQIIAAQRHNPTANSEKLVEIYTTIYNN